MSDPQPTAVLLSSSLDLLGAEPLCRQLRTRILAGEDVIVDGSQVERIATACVQLIVAAKKSAASRGLSFSLPGPSAALVDALADLGLADLLTDPES